MKNIKIIFLFVLCLAAISVCSQINNSSAVLIESSNTLINNTRKINSIQSTITKLEKSIEENKIKESFFSDIIGTNISWFAVLIGVIGLGVGAIGWNKYNKVTKELISTQIKLKEEFNHIATGIKMNVDEKLFQLENNLLKYRRLISNSYMTFSLLNEMSINDKINFNISALGNDLCEKNFFDQLSIQNQEMILKENRIDILSLRFRCLIQNVELLNAQSFLLLEDKFYSYFENLQFTEKIENIKEIKKLQRKVLVLLENKIQIIKDTQLK